MKGNVKLMPAIMTILSALYFIYVMSSADTTLLADTVGGDPGGKVLPMTMALFLFFGFLYLTLKERPEEKGINSEVRKLFLTTLSLSAVYVVFIRHIGFILLSAGLLYTLEYIFTTIDEVRDKKKAVIGGLRTAALITGAYFIMRTITRSFMSLGRTGAFPKIFASSAFEACISILYVALLTIGLNKIVYGKLRSSGMKRIADASLLTIATVLLLYVVFKQFFSVNLAPGILNF